MKSLTLIFVGLMTSGNLSAGSVYDLTDVVPVTALGGGKHGVNIAIRKDTQTESLFRFLKSGSSPVTCDFQFCKWGLTSAGVVVKYSDSAAQADARKHGIADVKEVGEKNEWRRLRFDRDAAEYVYGMLRKDSSNKQEGSKIFGKNILCQSGVSSSGADRYFCDIDINEKGEAKEILKTR